MDNNEAFSAIQRIRRKFPELSLKVICVDDVLDYHGWPDTPANREHVARSWEFRHWGEMSDSDWDAFSWMDDAPDADETLDNPVEV